MYQDLYGHIIKKMNAKRIFILGDIHIGIRSSTVEWQDITESYFNDFFIPLLKERVKPGDVLIQLGDVFDNRQSINIKVQHIAIKYFEIISKILPTYIIAGNHDCYNKKSNEVSSLDCLKFIPNLYIYKEPKLIDFGKAKCLMLPWCSTAKQESEILESFKNKADYVFSHSEMAGLMLNRKVKQEHGTPINSFSAYKRVYSGHIHYSLPLS